MCATICETEQVPAADTCVRVQTRCHVHDDPSQTADQREGLEHSKTVAILCSEFLTIYLMTPALALDMYTAVWAVCFHHGLAVLGVERGLYL